MSWFYDAKRNQPDLIVEGKIAVQIRESIPGCDKRVQANRFLFFPDSIKSTANTTLAKGLTTHIANLGFWDLSDRLVIPSGEAVVTKLMFLTCPGDNLILVPLPDDPQAVVDTAGKQFRAMTACPNFERVPGVDGNHAMMVGYGAQSASRSNQMNAVASEWRRVCDRLAVYFSFEILTQNPCHFMIGWGALPDGVLARTVYAINGNRPGITERYPMIFNQNVSWSALNADPTSSQFDFQSVLLHETGHALGLDHLEDSSSNVMYHSIAPGEIKRTLQGDDVNCISNLY